jgi:hypothetical protein
MLEQGGFVQELSGSYDLWSWRHRRVVEDGDPEAWKVVRGWRFLCDLSTTSTGAEDLGLEGMRKIPD